MATPATQTPSEPASLAGVPRRSTPLALLPFAFVIAALLALAVSPILMVRRLDELRDETESTIGPSSSLVPQLSLVFTQEATEHDHWRLTRDTAALARYRGFRGREDTIFARLDTLAPRIDTAVVARVAELRRLAGRWHGALDARVGGRIADTEFESPPVVALADSLRAATDSLEGALHGAMEADIAEGEGVVRGQRRISVALGLLALLAVLMVARSARRERELTRRLARAVEEEARLRAVAEQRREDVERIGESKARLMRGFGHDVKNPLGAADGYLQLLEEGMMDPVTPRQKEGLEKARRSVAAALNLIEDLLEIARAETGNIAVARVPTDVCRVVREAAEEYRAQAEAKGLALEVELPDGLPLVESDPVRVRQVLGNLISNAVKYTPRGRVSVRAGVRPYGRGPGARPRLAVEVSDTGLGIPREKQRLLFQEFVRFEPGAAQGTGLGLAISSRIVQALGGDITLESDAGRGSTFVLWLPLEGAPSAAERGAGVLAHPAG
ncbi:MAG TPA: HAMP domain-containing sensor histidine kinase [Longimicrobium sp.]